MNIYHYTILYHTKHVTFQIIISDIICLLLFIEQNKELYAKSVLYNNKMYNDFDVVTT